MDSEIFCPLCAGQSQPFHQNRKRSFFRCEICQGIFLLPAQRLSILEEKERYLFHKNDVEDKGYQAYMQPLVDVVSRNHMTNETVLDYGSGPSSVVARMLSDKGFVIKTFDPIFCNDQSLLIQTYDFIVCTEVIEHFYSPLKEFISLAGMLNENGKLYCTTRLYLPEIDFSGWFYKNDSTHVFFYAPETILYISKYAGFNRFTIDDRLIVFEK